MLNLKNLQNCFESAKEKNAKFIGVKIEMFGFEENELIINPRINFDKKLKYYIGSYNDDLTLKNAPDKIKIVGFSYGDNFEEIQRDLM